MRTLLAAVTLVLTVAPCSLAQENAPPNPNMRRPIDARDSVWIEEKLIEYRAALTAAAITKAVAQP